MEAAVTQGGRPFGAVVTDGEGRVVAEAKGLPSIDPRDHLTYWPNARGDA